MSNLAVKHKKQEQKQTSSAPMQAQALQAKTKVTRFEKLLYGAFLVFVVYACIGFIGNKADMYKVNAKSSDLQRNIEAQKRVNADLQAEVEQLSRYDRISKKAKELGLQVDENNVKGLNQ